MAVRADLGCDASELTYNFETQQGTLKMAQNQSCDLGGGVKLFTSIDRNVRIIETVSGGKPDGIFKREGTEWKSVVTR